MLWGGQALDSITSPLAHRKTATPDLSLRLPHPAAYSQKRPQRALARPPWLKREAKQLFHIASGRRSAKPRGHKRRVIDTTRCYMAINAMAPEVHYDANRLPRYEL